ncbi:MAG: fructosamine kinase family protein [Wenzhouxiangella sp.]
MPLTLEQAAEVAGRLGLGEDGVGFHPVGGGDTSQTYLLQAGTGSVFVKIESSDRADLLAAEADGLEALASAACVRVPEVLGQGLFEAEAGSWLALEALRLKPRSRSIDRRLGGQLAGLHRHQGEAFGWHRDNYLGPMPQSNATASDWGEFFYRQRLAPQIDRLLHAAPAIDRLVEPVLAAWRRLSAEHEPAASLLHGDLWAGNAAALRDDTPVIYDPAVHYGDRECDLAMADLFGGYAEAFFSAYQQAWPLPQGWQQRRGFYQLYHLLNHANLFGGSYAARIEQSMQALIADH